MAEAAANTRGYHILGHMDYLDRYVRDKGMIPPFAFYKDQVAAVLEHLIQKDLVLEYNTAGKYKGLSYGNPKEDILRLYRDLGASGSAFLPTATNRHTSAGISNRRKII